MTRWMLDATADTLPPGLIGTPFEAVYRALRAVASGVWDVDPAVYRAGIAWGYYLLERPAILENFPELVSAALVSEGVPLVRASQTPDELVALLRVWFSYRPTYERLEALLACYAVEAEVRPISDPDCQLVLPVSDTRLAYYIRVLGMDFTRPLSLADVADIARNASPMGANPIAFYAVSEGATPEYIAPAGSGILYSFINGGVVSEDVNALPTVSFTDILGADNITVGAGNAAGYIQYWANGAFTGGGEPWDPSCTYSTTIYYPGDGSSVNPCGIFEPISYPWSGSDYISVKNISQSSKQFRACVIAICASNSAVVETVYNASNVAFNAFKYTLSGTDYYYVLDQTQTDWVSDLSGIGYHLNYIDVLCGFRYNDGAWQSVTFTANDYWYSGIMNASDVARINDFGLQADTGRGGFGPNGAVQYNARLVTYRIIDFYSDEAGTQSVPFDISNFALTGFNYGGYIFPVRIDSTNAFATPCKTWKLRITKL